MSFRVDLNVFRGPLDLLLYLVRKHEVEITELPIAPITEQFLEYLSLLKELDFTTVGDFVDVASMLIEIKSRSVLPRMDEIEDPVEDPRQELVRRLLEYKKYKDAASILDERSRAWQEHHPRRANDLPPRERNLAEEPIREVELWDLVSAFGRILRENVATKPSSIVYDDTPIHVYMEQIHARLVDEGSLTLGSLFKADMHRSTQIGIFLALLELIRHHHVLAEQGDLFAEIKVLPGANIDAPLNVSEADQYEHGAGAVESEPSEDA